MTDHNEPVGDFVCTECESTEFIHETEQWETVTADENGEMETITPLGVETLRIRCSECDTLIKDYQ